MSIKTLGTITTEISDHENLNITPQTLTELKLSER
jgi:hypothetical protein